MEDLLCEAESVRRLAGARLEKVPDEMTIAASLAEGETIRRAAALLRHRHQASRQLSEVVPSRRARHASIAKSLPRNRQTKPAIRELSLTKKNLQTGGSLMLTSDRNTCQDRVAQVASGPAGVVVRAGNVQLKHRPANSMKSRRPARNRH